MGERGQVCLSLGVRFRIREHWPKVRHDCSDPWCPQKVCEVCGKQVRECIESQKEQQR